MSLQPVSITIPGDGASDTFRRAGLYSTTSGTMLPVTFDSWEDADDFDRWFRATRNKDPRSCTDHTLTWLKGEWEKDRKAVKA